MSRKSEPPVRVFLPLARRGAHRGFCDDTGRPADVIGCAACSVLKGGTGWTEFRD